MQRGKAARSAGSCAASLPLPQLRRMGKHETACEKRKCEVGGKVVGGCAAGCTGRCAASCADRKATTVQLRGFPLREAGSFVLLFFDFAQNERGKEILNVIA